MPHLPSLASNGVFAGPHSGQDELSRSSSFPGKVSGTKKPRVRPPRGIRDGLPPLIKRLPGYSGPYNVIS